MKKIASFQSGESFEQHGIYEYSRYELAHHSWLGLEHRSEGDYNI